MNGADLLPASVLKRKAVVYVRQSTPAQVQFNLESQRQQYELVEVARRRGFDAVEIIDDDLGKSASGMVARPGFERLVASLCAGHVGAVLCLDASRLARNGRDWHHLLELCGLVEARVIDLEGVYDPGRPNDRLLLGMKGSISEFELGILRARMLEAARAKARRGELRISVPIGYVWHRDLGLGSDPDLRNQEAIRQIFQRFRQLGSARSVHLAMAADQVHFPRPSDGQKLVTFDWAPIRYRNVISVLKNPFYAGAYAYGKSEMRIEIVEGRARKSYGHGRPLEDWEVLLKDHTRGTSIGGSLIGTRPSSPRTPMAWWAAQSPGEADAPSCPGSSPAGAADDGWRWPIRDDARAGRSIVAIAPTRCWADPGAWDLAARGLRRRSRGRSSSSWNRWPSRPRWELSEGGWKAETNDSASRISSCSRLGTRPRWPNAAMRRAIPTIV